MNTPTRVNSELVAPWAPLKSKNPTPVYLSSINLSEDIASADDMEELIRKFNAMSLEDNAMSHEDNSLSLEDDGMEELIRNFKSMSLEDDMDDIISRFNEMSLDDDLRSIPDSKREEYEDFPERFLWNFVGKMEQIEEDYYYMDVVQDDYYQEHYTLPEDQLYGIENICKYEDEQPHPNVTISRGNRPSTQEDYEEDEYFICLKDEFKSI